MRNQIGVLCGELGCYLGAHGMTDDNAPSGAGAGHQFAQNRGQQRRMLLHRESVSRSLHAAKAREIQGVGMSTGRQCLVKRGGIAV